MATELAKRVVVFVAATLAFSSCSIKSIDSVKDKQLEMCKTIHDEALRVQCITSVKSHG